MIAYMLRPAGAEDAEVLYRIHRAAMGEHLARALGMAIISVCAASAGNGGCPSGYTFAVAS